VTVTRTTQRPPGPGTIWHTTVPSPLGELLLISDGTALRGLVMQRGPRPIRVDTSWVRSPSPFSEAVVQLDQYFAGERRAFDLPLVLDGTPFQLRVWAALQEIPYATTISYGELARRIGCPLASRAVGLANGRNPVSIIVPCHRVIGADGSLTGYGGGLDRKRWLLDLEGGVVAGSFRQLRFAGLDAPPGRR
jgi:methylated-DNA-[protein]-cysteine S-methyltransferase